MHVLIVIYNIHMNEHFFWSHPKIVVAITILTRLVEIFPQSTKVLKVPRRGTGLRPGLHYQNNCDAKGTKKSMNE